LSRVSLRTYSSPLFERKRSEVPEIFKEEKLFVTGGVVGVLVSKELKVWVGLAGSAEL